MEKTPVGHEFWFSKGLDGNRDRIAALTVNREDHVDLAPAGAMMAAPVAVPAGPCYETCLGETSVFALGND